MAGESNSEEFSFPRICHGDEDEDNSIDLTNSIWHHHSSDARVSDFCSFPTCHHNNSTRKNQYQQNQHDEEEEFSTPRSSATPNRLVFVNKLYDDQQQQEEEEEDEEFTTPRSLPTTPNRVYSNPMGKFYQKEEEFTTPRSIPATPKRAYLNAIGKLYQKEEEFTTSRSVPTTPNKAYLNAIGKLYKKEEEFSTPRSIPTTPNKVYLNPVVKLYQKEEEFSTPRSPTTGNRDFMRSIEKLWDYHELGFGGCTTRRSFSGDDEEEKMDMLWEEYNYEEFVAMEMNRQRQCGEKSSTADDSSSSASTPGMDGLCCVQVIHTNQGAAVVPMRRTAGLNVIIKVLKKLFLLHSPHRRH